MPGKEAFGVHFCAGCGHIVQKSQKSAVLSCDFLLIILFNYATILPVSIKRPSRPQYEEGRSAIMADENKTFDPKKFDPNDATPPKMDKDGNLPPFPDFGDLSAFPTATEDDNLLTQEDPLRWLRQPPKKMRGDMRAAFKFAGEADKYKCTCWNKRCPYYGDCRKCIVFHMALKQIPTCQRDMVVELMREGILQDELYMNDPVPPKEPPKAK